MFLVGVVTLVLMMTEYEYMSMVFGVMMTWMVSQ